MSEIKTGNGKGMFMPEVTVEMFRNAPLETIEELIAEGEVFDIDLKETIHREKEQAYMQGFEDGAKQMREHQKEQIARLIIEGEKAYKDGYIQGVYDTEFPNIDRAEREKQPKQR